MSNIPQNPLLIFDCDGVLIDSEKIYLDVEFGFLAKRGIDIDRRDYVREFMALPQEAWKRKMSDLLEKHTGEPLGENDYRAIKDESRGRVLAEVTPIDGVTDMLGRLKSPRCVASSTMMVFLPPKLEKTGLATYFGEHVYSGDMVENGKPAPDLFLHAARGTGGVPAEHCIVIEDSANGVKGGKAAGMFTIGFLGGSHVDASHSEELMNAGADIVLESHSHLADWLGANTKAMH